MNNKPWGTKPQCWDSMDKLDINLADATALYKGIIDSMLLNCNGNLIITHNKQINKNAIKVLNLS